MELGVQDRVVVVVANDDVDQAACATVLRGEGCGVVTAAEITDASATVERALADHGRVDGVVVYLAETRARILDGAGLDELAAGWTAVEAVAAAFRVAIPSMSERGWGRLVSVTTSALKWLDDDVDEPGVVTGLGVLGMHKAIVADVARLGIATNAVLRGRAAAPDEVASTVAFLLSDLAGYLQGVSISLDGASSPVVF